VATQNLTLAIEKDVLLEARKYALEHGTSVNKLVREYLAGLSDQEERRRRAREHWLNGPKTEIGPITWKREDLYER
jgi:uncharacterized protein DUF6364